MKGKVKSRSSKMVRYSMYVVVLLVFALTLLACDRQGDYYLKSQKNYLNYTFQSKDWTYSTEVESYNNALGGTSEYSINTISFINSKGLEDTFELKTDTGGTTFRMATNVYHKMTQILESDIAPIIEQYADLDDLYIFCDYYSSSSERQSNNYDDSEGWSKWLVNRKNGVKLYDIYEFVEDNLAAKESNSGYITIQITLTDTNDLDTYEELQYSINEIYDAYSKQIGFQPDMEMIISYKDMNEVGYFINGMILD